MGLKPINSVSDKENLLLIFVKNPILGKVKTRLAKVVGDEKALEIYKSLLLHTANITRTVNCHKIVFYDSFIDEQDLWDNKLYGKAVQTGKILGERMQKAFSVGFNQGYKNIIIIGSDCIDLTTSIIENAFSCLQHNDFVIGPAKDGGYYLLGMNKEHIQVFENKKWSTVSVYRETIADFKSLEGTYAVLPELSDIDEVTDLKTPSLWL